jgi:formate dehydrogenase iron-sulfur subunit
MKAAILTDTTKCIGCRECEFACKKENHLAPDIPRRWDRDDGLSARDWTSVVEGPGHAFVRKQCRHCVEPACASVCPVGALHKISSGPVVYDKDRCMGCRYCMMACPYGIPRYEWDAAVPYVRKCIFCYETRLAQGRQPACTEACPVKATVFGDRDELLAEAHRRIADNPGKYLGKVWGEREAGGASVLLISNVDLSFLTEDRYLGAEPLPETTAAAMHAVPFVFTGVLGAMAGLSWIVERRMARQRDKSDE